MEFGVDKEARKKMIAFIAERDRAIERLTAVYKYLVKVGKTSAVGLSLRLDLPLALVHFELKKLQEKNLVEELENDSGKPTHT